MIPVQIGVDGVPEFTNHQVDDYGLPDEWGFEMFRIVESRDTMDFATDYKLEQSYSQRKVHRYDRKARFTTTIRQLMGERGKVPIGVLGVIKGYFKIHEPWWEQVRRILKHYKFRLYYNRIPLIIRYCTGQDIIDWKKCNRDFFTGIMEQFNDICYQFDLQKEEIGRKYFPCMRFIALKLLETNSIPLNYEIPRARTARKKKDLEELWNILNCKTY